MKGFKNQPVLSDTPHTTQGKKIYFMDSTHPKTHSLENHASFSAYLTMYIYLFIIF